MARAVKQVAAARRVQVEKDAGNDNYLFLQTRLEEVEAVGNGLGETLEIEPPIVITSVGVHSKSLRWQDHRTGKR